jgi:dienelactone hydrolase
MTAAAPSGPHIEATPREALADAPVLIRLVGYAPGATVALQARMQDSAGRWWASRSSYIVGADGAVDLRSQAPVSGAYAVADAMGFLWAMAPTGDEPITGPFAKTTLEPTTIELSAEADGQPVASTTLARLHVAPGVERRPVRDDGLVGTFFVPNGDGPFPTIMVLGGSGGGLSESTAALYASHGYAALALAYFRAEHLPADLLRIPLEYFETALRWLRAQPAVDPERLAVTGASRGGELALLLGSRYPELMAVIGNVPSSVVYGGVAAAPEAEGHMQPAWTYRGEGIPFMKSGRGAVVEQGRVSTGEPLPLTPMFLRTLEDAEQVRAASIPVERINGPVLLVSGVEDAMWPSSTFSNLVIERLEEHRFSHAHEHLALAGTGHITSPPWLPTTVDYMLHPVSNVMFALGGTPGESATGRAVAWQRTLAFLDAHLKR